MQSNNQDLVQAIEALTRATLLKSFSAVYPIGSIYMNKTNATNPADLFGFGTWVAIAGRVVVGKAASGTFATAGATGGTEKHTHDAYVEVAGGTAIPAGLVGYNAVYYGGGSAATKNVARNTVNATGDADSSLQPYVVAYMWERTA